MANLNPGQTTERVTKPPFISIDGYLNNKDNNNEENLSFKSPNNEKLSPNNNKDNTNQELGEEVDDEVDDRIGASCVASLCGYG